MAAWINFRIHLIALALCVVMMPIACGVGEERFEKAFDEEVWVRVIYFSVLIPFGITALFMYVHSWIMLIRSWSWRGTGRSLKLLFFLWFFGYFTTIYFYLNRYDIDPKTA